MDNKKVINLLRSVADLLEETQTNVAEPVTSIMPTTGFGAKVPPLPRKPFLEDLKDKLDKAKEKSDKLKTNVSEEKERFFQILKTVEENEKIQKYKSKIIKADEKMESILNGLDELRSEVVRDITNGAQKLAKILSKTEMKD